MAAPILQALSESGRSRTQVAYQNIMIAVDLTDEAEEIFTAARNVALEQGAAKLSAATIIRPLARTYGAPNSYLFCPLSHTGERNVHDSDTTDQQ